VLGTKNVMITKTAITTKHGARVLISDDTMTDGSGDSLTVSDVVLGSFNDSDYQDVVTAGESTYYEDCLTSEEASAGTQLPFCAYVDFTDGSTGDEEPPLPGQSYPSNTQEDAVYDACGNLVDEETTYGWHVIGEDYLLSPMYIGSLPTTVPSSGVCYGQWTVVFEFSQEFQDGDSLNASDSATFEVAPPPPGIGTTTADGGTNLTSHYQPGCNYGPYPVNCATGNFWHTFTDMSIPGRGLPLDLTRTYNSNEASSEGPFGYGWSCSYCMSLSVAEGTGDVTITQEDGATVTFTPNGSGGYVPPAWAVASLVENEGSTWTFTRDQDQIFDFSSAGVLTSESDLNGYTTTLSYSSGKLVSVTDPAGRSLSFSYGGNGLVSEVTDPAGRTVSYSYNGSDDLTSVTDVGGGVTSFTYSDNLLLTMTNPNGQSGEPDAGDEVTNYYNGSGQVTEQIDPMSRATTFSYSGDNLSSSGGTTTITNPNGDVTVEDYVYGELTSITQGYGTADAATTTYSYGAGALGPTSVTDPNGNITTYTYDADGDVLTKTDALANTWTYTYNSLDEVLTSQTPDQAAADVDTTNGYNVDGDLTATATTLPGGGEATTTYTYGDPSEPGDVTSITSPNGNTTHYAYDSYGYMTAQVDPLGRVTTYAYNILGERTSETSPGDNTDPAPGAIPGDIYTVAGPGPNTTSGDFGPALKGFLTNPDGVLVDSAGDIYIADSGNNRVQEVAAASGTQWGIAMTAGDVYTVAGSSSGTSGHTGDGGAATSALLDDPTGLALDSSGDIYIADAGNNRVQEVAATTGTKWGVSMTADDIYTVAGSSSGNSGHTGDAGAATSALLDGPHSLALDSSGDLYIADAANNRVQEVAATTGTQWGVSVTADDIYTVAGSSSGTSGHTGDTGAATSALLDGPDGVALDSSGDLYIADTFNNRVQEVAASTGTQWATSMTADDIYTVAGSSTGSSGHSGNGGVATSAKLSNPMGVALDSAGDLYISDSANNRAQEVAISSGTQRGVSMTANDIYTVAGSSVGSVGFSGAGGAATSAFLDGPTSLAIDSAGDIYLADLSDRVQEVAATTGTQWGTSMTANDLYVVAGAGTPTEAGNGGVATSGGLADPSSVAVDPAGDIYIADASDNRVQEVAATTGTQWGISMTAGDVYTVAGNAWGLSGDYGNGGPATSALLSYPVGMALDSAGDLYIGDTVNNEVQEVAATTHTQWGISMTAGDIYTVAGASSGTSGYTGDGGATTSALLNGPIGLAFDSAGDLYIADNGNSRIQEVAAATGTKWGISMTANDIYTVAGSSTGSSGHSGDGGAATSALLDGPYGVGLDSSGDLYIADYANNRVQEVAVSTGTQWGTSMTADDIYTVAGASTGASGYSGDGGAATSALLDGPFGVTVGPAGDLYIADSTNQAIREVAVSTGDQWGMSMTADDIYTLAGAPGLGRWYCEDYGLAADACLHTPSSIAIDAHGDLYIADSNNDAIREIWAGAPTTYAYDAYGDVTSLTNPDGDVTSATYDDLGNELSSTDARGYTTDYTYDADNELTEVTLPNSDTESYTYDGDGNKLTYVDARGKTTDYTYDALDRLTSVEDPNGHTTSYTYDGDGNQTSVTDADGDTTNYTYDADDRLVTLTGTASTIGSYTYDPDGNQTSFTNGLSQTTTYGYNYLDELTGTATTLGHTTTYSYDPDGNLATETLPSTKVTTYSYDADDELTGVSYSDGATHDVEYSYDPDGDVATMTDASGQSDYTYDQADRLTSYENGARALVSYAYDPDGDVTSLTYPNGQSVTKTYDDLDRLSSLTDWLSNTTTFSYDADSDLTGVDYPNGVDSAVDYDNADQLSSITDTKSATTLVSFSYTRDDYGDITAETDTGTPGAGTTDYSYNSLHQVTAAGASSYNYDDANDLTTGPGAATQAFNSDDELCWSGTGSGGCGSPPSGTTTYSYSTNGNRTARTPASGSSTSYSWNQAEQLTGVTTGASSASFVYDGNGLRQSETNGSGTTEFTWDPEGSLPVLLSDGANSYIYGPDDTPIEQISSGGTPTYLLTDQLGSTRAITNSSGSVTATFSYDAWGNLAGSTGSATTPFMYAGAYLDSSTGLYYMLARYYDPLTGQFLSIDPNVASTQMPFDYVGDDPVNGVDPSGALEIPLVHWCIGSCTHQPGPLMCPVRVGPDTPYFASSLSVPCGSGPLAVGTLAPGASAAQARAAAESSGWPIPQDYVAERADNNKGWIFRAPGTKGNANIIRVEEPDSKNPTGAVRIYNPGGQPLTAEGKPGSNEDTHLPLNPDDENNPGGAEEPLEEPLDPLALYYTGECPASSLV
jgi:RHS repeat-associated protein